ncbi:MAG: prepilin-type N-terminal cleavage/methylation domain-containing protein [Candidatus Omnitrophica bacterium]|nr:prepilin-type N-terminal cleavage/methylation domain-containing protein [Candidatus Omnitrophota bacterium]
MKNKKGFTLVEIMVVVAIISLVVSIVMPNFLKARETASANVCISNLKHIDDAKSMWAMWEGRASTDVPNWSDLITDYLRKTPSCPTNGTYSLNAVDAPPACTESGHVLS